MSEILTQSYLATLNIPKWLAKQVVLDERVDVVKEDKTVVKNNNEIIKLSCVVIEDKNNPHHQCLKNNNQQQLLVKMLAAIGLTKDNFTTLTTTNSECDIVLAKYQVNSILLLSDNIKPQHDNIFLCPHPADIITNSNLKRIAWNVLKDMQKII